MRLRTYPNTLSFPKIPSGLLESAHRYLRLPIHAGGINKDRPMPLGGLSRLQIPARSANSALRTLGTPSNPLAQAQQSERSVF
jgi:hypothetical protein